MNPIGATLVVRFGGLLICLALLIFIVLPAHGWETYNFAPVRVGSGAAFLVTDGVGEDADDRARRITREMSKILRNPELKPEEVKAAKLSDNTYAVTLGDQVLAQVTARDARVFGTTEARLAQKWADSVRKKASRLEPLYRKGNKFDIKMLGEHQVLLLLLQIAILLFAAFICGELVARTGQPAVIGQMLAGILLGKSVFGAIFPDIAGVVFPVAASQSNLLEVLSWIGVIFLLMLTGLETDVELIRAQSRSAAGASVLGIIVPFSVGFGFTFLIPGELLLNPHNRLIVALFIGTVFSVSSVPVIAKILMEMQLLRRNVAQVILATALVHDTIGCIILALVAALASAHSLGPELLKAPVGTALFVAIAILGRNYFFSMLRWIKDNTGSDEALVTAVTVLLLLSASFTQFVGVHVVLGAFMVGFLLSLTSIVNKKVIHAFELVTMGIFAPVFFAAAGLHVNLQLLAKPTLLILTILMSLAACASKVGANFVGGRWGGLSKWEALCLGFGANAPGAMGLIVGILGYSMGIITVELLSIIIVMSLITTAMTPPLMKWSLKHIEVGEEEQERLEKEETKAGTHIGGITRVLLATDGDHYTANLARLLKAVGMHHRLEATLMCVKDQNHSSSSKSEDDSFKDTEEQVYDIASGDKVTLVTRNVVAEERVARIIEEANLGYSLILMGASENTKGDATVFGEYVDSIVMQSPCSVFVMKDGEPDQEAARKEQYKHILIPTTGADSSRMSTELGLTLAKFFEAKVTCLSVIESVRAEGEGEDMDHAHNLAQDIADSAAKLAEAFDVKMDTIVREAQAAGPEILTVADEVGADAIILGGIRRPTKDLFLGQIISHVLNNSRGTVGVYIL